MKSLLVSKLETLPTGDMTTDPGDFSIKVDLSVNDLVLLALRSS